MFHLSDIPYPISLRELPLIITEYGHALPQNSSHVSMTRKVETK